MPEIQDTDSQAVSAVETYAVKVWDGVHLQPKRDELAEEVPIALVYNGISHVVMLGTPQDLEDFALGFSLTEGLIQSRQELYAVETVRHAQGVELHCEISSERLVGLKERRRNLLGRTGCGLCGAENIAQAMRVIRPLNLVPRLEQISFASIERAFRQIRDYQALQKVTGATHACAWADDVGRVRLVCEDVGRHNALDKLIGALVGGSHVDSAGFVLTTSRASYEMVQKVTSVGVDLLAAISAPTGLAVRVARENGVTLLGFVRDNRHVVYAGEERIDYKL